MGMMMMMTFATTTGVMDDPCDSSARLMMFPESYGNLMMMISELYGKDDDVCYNCVARCGAEERGLRNSLGVVPKNAVYATLWCGAEERGLRNSLVWCRRTRPTQLFGRGDDEGGPTQLFRRGDDEGGPTQLSGYDDGIQNNMGKILIMTLPATPMMMMVYPSVLVCGYRKDDDPCNSLGKMMMTTTTHVTLQDGDGLYNPLGWQLSLQLSRREVVPYLGLDDPFNVKLTIKSYRCLHIDTKAIFGFTPSAVWLEIFVVVDISFAWLLHVEKCWECKGMFPCHHRGVGVRGQLSLPSQRRWSARTAFLNASEGLGVWGSIFLLMRAPFSDVAEALECEGASFPDVAEALDCKGHLSSTARRRWSARGRLFPTAQRRWECEGPPFPDGAEALGVRGATFPRRRGGVGVRGATFPRRRGGVGVRGATFPRRRGGVGVRGATFPRRRGGVGVRGATFPRRR
uniref:Uncharacterized protein n=1 Tax=Timema poppense TaxID=170557 RepID=A0A7R9H4M0_TIMPO|nr:unnamed protein product [Timema poppensis]